jgi:hypothetical protein
MDTTVTVTISVTTDTTDHMGQTHHPITKPINTVTMVIIMVTPATVPMATNRTVPGRLRTFTENPVKVAQACDLRRVAR